MKTSKENQSIRKSTRTFKFTASYEVFHITATSYRMLRRSAVTF
ncbi:unnamed protein product [Spodoptera exigua]|nr:unnamed protein product [Spodoptera exigua]